MSKRNPQEVSKNFETRVLIIQGLVLAIFAVLGIRFYVLQVMRHEQYTQRAENNRIRDIPILATRGQILDRNGKVLVDSTPAFNVVIYPEDMEDREKTINALVENLGIDRDEVTKELSNPYRPKSEPVLVKQNAGHADDAWISAHKEEHPEIEIVDQPQRVYPYGKTACHVLGYIGQISQRQLEKEEYAGYKQGDIIGQGGIEATYDKILRGRNGVRRVIVDSRGRPIRELEVIKPVKGQDIVTTIDVDLQRVAEEQFVKMNDKGAAIAVDPRNGEILLLVSYPNFDPNVFARNVISDNRKEVAEILLDKGHPLNNKAIQGYYPAGSTWKLLLSTAAIEEGITPLNSSRLACGGGIQVGNRFVRCMGSHGSPDVHVAIVRSCDGYYYRLGLKMGVDLMNDWLQRFGMGVKTGIDLPHERTGSIPSRAWKARVNPRDPQWKDFDSVLAGIGQGSVAISPHQLLRAVSGIVVGGHFYTPHVFKEARATYALRDGLTVEVEPARHYEGDVKELKLADETVRTIRQAVWGVVNEGGTAGGVGFPREFNVGGKTGTAQVIATAKAIGKNLQDHSWFISFAPINKDTIPEIGSVVFTENGGFGAKASGPKAKAIYDAYFAKKNGQPIPAELLAGGEAKAKPVAAKSGDGQAGKRVGEMTTPVAAARDPRQPADAARRRNP